MSSARPATTPSRPASPPVSLWPFVPAACVALTASDAVCHSYRLPPDVGHGWMETHHFGSGFALARMYCQFQRAQDNRFHATSDSLRLMLLLEGQQCVLNEAGHELHVCPGDILVRNGRPEVALRDVRTHGRQLSVALDMPRTRVMALQASGRPLAHLGAEGACRVLRPPPHVAARFMGMGYRLLSVPEGGDQLAAIELQALALDLLHKLLAEDACACNAGLSAGSTSARTSPAEAAAGDAAALGRPTARRWHKAVDEVIALLHAHWNQPLTIAQLARRAGINECYLKDMFRQRTGQTIAAYRRSLRMQRARQMLECEGLTVQQAAHACGYARADKFSQAFLREHGVLPSAL